MESSPDDYKGNSLLAVAIVCTVLSTLSFVGRLWGRSLSALSFGWDDFLMAIAMVSVSRTEPPERKEADSEPSPDAGQSLQ